jgi:sortase (surface protein transpeptidase)
MKSKVFITIGTIFWTLTAIFALLPSWPHIYYRLSPQTSSLLASTIASTAIVAQATIKPLDSPSPLSKGEAPPQAGRGISPTPTPLPLPPVDPSLPAENGLIIDQIGVRGQIHEGEDWETILKQGIWRVPNFSTPIDQLSPLSKGDQGGFRPIILAAHRWGYLEWSAAFRKLNSFYHLPELKVGDTIQVLWDQRLFEYKVYSVETGTKITDYNAKLILYTCQLWNSPVRFFVYANRIN